jgi:hypothetical protein
MSSYHGTLHLCNDKTEWNTSNHDFQHCLETQKRGLRTLHTLSAGSTSRLDFIWFLVLPSTDCVVLDWDFGLRNASIIHTTNSMGRKVPNCCRMRLVQHGQFVQPHHDSGYRQTGNTSRLKQTAQKRPREYKSRVIPDRLPQPAHTPIPFKLQLYQICSSSNYLRLWCLPHLQGLSLLFPQISRFALLRQLISPQRLDAAPRVLSALATSSGSLTSLVLLVPPCEWPLDYNPWRRLDFDTNFQALPGYGR